MSSWPFFRWILLALAALPSYLFTEMEPSFRKELDAHIQENRTSEFMVTVKDSDGLPLPHLEVQAELVRHDFLFGTAVAAWALAHEGGNGDRYRAFVLDHFNSLVAENAMKWPQSEPDRGVDDFSGADRMINFAEKHNLRMRGHCLFWSKEKWQSDWVVALPPDELKEAMTRRIHTLLDRYADHIRDWDMNNEMIHGGFFARRLGEDIQPWMFQVAQKRAPDARLFVNEYSIVDNDEHTEAYLAHIRDLQQAGAPVGGIGIQEHAAERFAGTRGGGDEVERGSTSRIDPRAAWQRLDLLAETGLPIHITEVSFKTNDEQVRAEALETFYRLSFAHPAVEAFFLWGFWEGAHWLGGEAALMRKDGSLTPAAEVLNRLVNQEWTTRLEQKTNANGTLSFRGFDGIYKIRITLPDGSQQIHRLQLNRKSSGADLLLREHP